MPRKFANAAYAHSVDSSEEESFQFIFKNVQWRVRWTYRATGRLFHTAGPPWTRKLRSP